MPYKHAAVLQGRSTMSTQSPILYIYPGASSLFPHILFQYAGIPFTPQLTHPTDADLIAINPKLQVPVLVLDGQIVVTENPAIAHAVNQLAPDKQIFGRNDVEFLRVCEWMNWIATSLQAQAWQPYVLMHLCQSETIAYYLTAFNRYVRPWRFTNDKSGEAAVKAASEQKLGERFSMLESMLNETGPWALGDHFTAADAFLFHWYRSAKSRLGPEVVAKYPRWTRVYSQASELEAVKKALEIEEEMRAHAKPFT